MTLSVGYISDEIHILAFLSAEHSINSLDYHLDDIDILPLVETADVIGLGYLTLVENHIDGTGMIHYIQPVAHVLTLTIYWQWLAMTDVVDEQRNQLLRELVWTVVVRAVGHARIYSIRFLCMSFWNLCQSFIYFVYRGKSSVSIHFDTLTLVLPARSHSCICSMYLNPSSV